MTLIEDEDGAPLPEAVQAVVRDLLAAKAVEAWEDGYDAGHMDARAVQSSYPDPTPNPYRRPPADSAWLEMECHCCRRPEHKGRWGRLLERLTGRT